MSLLLDALKKAEKAKEEAQRRERSEPEAGLRLQDDAAQPAPPVRTRAELPDISQPLEILSDDISPAKLSAAAAPKASAGARARNDAPDNGQERATARKVFEVKYKEPNPRLPFYIAMGALGLAAVCTVVYFWYQLRPAPSLVNANPSPASQGTVAAAPNPQPAPDAAAAPSAVQSIPGLPPSPASPAASKNASSPPPAAMAAAPPKRAEPAPIRRATRAPSRQARRTPPQALVRSTRPASPQVSFERPVPKVHPGVDSGYAAYQAGDLASARTAYENALRDEPANRDALLGLAAVDVRSGRLGAAEATYLKLLHANPRDAHAQAGLIALRAERIDPLAAESRVKTLLAGAPDAHVLNFSLGNQLAQQGRWSEAQQQYFKAFSADPENGDFAYNVAVSLDHLRQTKLALEYYRRALLLAARRGASFDAAAVRQRITQLSG